MLSTVLLCFSIVFFLYILIYALCFLLLPFIRPEEDKPLLPSELDEEILSGDICVLIPCHNEGAALGNAVQSVLDQDYPGHVHVVVLFGDTQDSAFEPLKERFQFNWKSEQKEAVIFESATRKASIFCTGFGPKHNKLNCYLPKVDAKYLAFLDADHRGRPDWLSTSIRQLAKGGYVGVQSRRWPLSLKRITQIWDSAQNHIGNELVNSALSKYLGTVFFTGTACVFFSEPLKGRSFDRCVAEDTYLTLELLIDDHKIAYNRHTGTVEEVTPDVFSYIARRRRFSCGHTWAFFALVGKVLRAKIAWQSKAVVFIHGLFYTLPSAICLLFNGYSFHLFTQYTPAIRTLITVVSIAISLLVTLFLYGKHRSVLREAIVFFLWVFPLLNLVFPFVLRTMEHELYYFLLSFPYSYQLIWSHLFCILTPMVLLIIGAFRLRFLQAHHLILVGLGYPIIFFLDVWASLLGVSDYLFGRPTWAKIRRTHEEDLLDAEGQTGSFWIITRWTAAIGLCGFLIVSFNDLTADPNCGEPDAHLFEPSLFVPQSEVNWRLTTTKKILDEDTIAVNLQSSFSKPLSTDAQLIHIIDGRQVGQITGNGSTNYEHTFAAPLGWSPHIYEAKLKVGGGFCQRAEPFTTTHKQFRDKSFFVNGEKFLVKGVIPSFSTSRMDISLTEGIEQIKALGANTVRYYYSLKDEVREVVSQKNMLVIDQPDRSTWDDVNLHNPLGRRGLRKRFESLQKEFQGFPFTLFHTLGNELEIRSPSNTLPKLRQIMRQVIDNGKSDFFSYSTYFVYLRLPAGIYGVNMLDSSETYWTIGLQALQAIDKPFYASEFGGFVAEHERTPPELRAYRIHDHWQRILEAGAFGAIFHQSHDNYAQPVIASFNDPLSADHPDDVRGIWDQSNKEKPIARFVKQLFSDFSYQVVDEMLAIENKNFKLRLKNIREYNLKEIQIKQDGTHLAGPYDFGPGEEKIITLPLDSSGKPLMELAAHYTTHRGLNAQSSISVRLPIALTTPQALNSDALDVVSEQTFISGRLIRSSSVDVVLPGNWQQVRVNGKLHEIDNPRKQFPVRPSMEQAVQLEISRDDKEWFPVDPKELGSGPHRVRFKLKRKYEKGARLLLAGLGTTKYWIRYGQGEWEKNESHAYRENHVLLDDFDYSSDDYFYLLLTRDELIYLKKKDSPFNRNAIIKFEMPKVFSPSVFEVERVL